MPEQEAAADKKTKRTQKPPPTIFENFTEFLSAALTDGEERTAFKIESNDEEDDRVFYALGVSEQRVHEAQSRAQNTVSKVTKKELHALLVEEVQKNNLLRDPSNAEKASPSTP